MTTTINKNQLSSLSSSDLSDGNNIVHLSGTETMTGAKTIGVGTGDALTLGTSGGTRGQIKYIAQNNSWEVGTVGTASVSPSSNNYFFVYSNDVSASLFTIDQTGAVKTYNNTLDDGSGNVTIAGTLTYPYASGYTSSPPPLGSLSFVALFGISKGVWTNVLVGSTNCHYIINFYIGDSDHVNVTTNTCNYYYNNGTYVCDSTASSFIRASGGYLQVYCNDATSYGRNVRMSILRFG